MSSNNSSAGGGIGIAGSLGVVFIVLKLTGVIHWDWLWVLAPFWISIGLSLLILGVIGVVVLTFKALDRRDYKKRVALQQQKRADWRSA